jgi:ParB/RepB/Spo0J family partition protein
MRADAHYVDQLEAPAQPVIRMVKTGQIDCRDLPAADHLEELTKSVGIHGVLQPLLVRRQGGRYSLIAGRKRLASAIAAGLAVVPCALHDAEGPAAAALATADNLRGDDAAATPEAERAASHQVLQAISSDLAAIRTSIALVTAGSGLPQRVGAGLIDSQAARAKWLLTCLLGTFENTGQAPLGAIVHRVASEFERHSSLTGLELECSVSPAAAVWKLPEDSAAAAISGAVFATVSCLEGVSRQRIELHADTQHPRAVKVEVVQRAARVAPTLGATDRIAEIARPSDLLPALALRLARNIAGPLGGGAELTPLPGIGSVLQITFGLTS